MNDEGLQRIYDDATEGMFSGVEVHMLVDEVRSLRAKLDAVPVDAMGMVMEVADIPFGYLAERNSINAWLEEMGWRA